MNTIVFSRLNGNKVKDFEALEYTDIDRIVKYVCQAGLEPVNDYIYAANELIKRVLSQNESDWELEFQKFIIHLQKGEGGTKTIDRFMISIWPSIFRGFYFASSKWKKEDCSTNYKSLINLYRTISKNETFNQSVIDDTLSIFQGIVTTDVLVHFTDYILKLEIKSNWNKYKNFFEFVSRSITTVYRIGFIKSNVPWEFQDLSSSCDITETQNIIQKIIDEMNDSVKVLDENKWVTSKEVLGYPKLLKYFEYLLNVMRFTDASPIVESPKLRTKIQDVTYENIKKINSLKTEKEFEDAINKNDNHLPPVNIIDLLKNRNNILH